VILEYLRQERQTAAECLFFLAYHTQLTAVEVAGMIQLLKDVTNGISDKDFGLPIQDPFEDVTDVPDAYHKQDASAW